MHHPILDERLQKRQAEFYPRFQALMPRGIRHNPPHGPYFTGYEYETLYDWDQYFDAILVGYAGLPMDFPRNGIRVFLSLQEADGYVPRSYHPAKGVYPKHNVMFKPFLAQLALLTIQQDGRLDWLQGADTVYEKLKRYFFCWGKRFDVRGKGLVVWNEAEHTGMDNHVERAGEWGEDNAYCEGIDLNAYLFREGAALAVLADMLGYRNDAEEIRSAIEALRQSIQRWLWDEERGFFFDYHAKKNEPIPVMHVGAFAALWAGIATPEQAERMVKEHLLNEKEFWRAFPLPALAATEPGYSEGYLPTEKTTRCTWRGNTWIPTNYYTIQGLRSYGYDAEARSLAEKTFRLFDRGPFSEYYTSDSGVGTGLKPFWGWSSLAIFAPAEIELGVDTTALAPVNGAITQVRQMFLEKSY